MSINVAATGLTASEITAPGLGVLRSLKAGKKFQGRLIGLVYDPLESGSFEPDAADEVYVLPYPSQGRASCFERLAYIHDRTKLDVLIPNLDAELPMFLRNREQLQAMGVRTFLPSTESFAARSKDRMPALARKHGWDVPRTLQINSENELAEAVREIGFPLFIKGLYYEAFLVRSLEEALSRLGRIVDVWGYPALLQERIVGREFNVCALGDGRGGLIGAVPITKLTISEKGKAWAGVTVRNQDLLDLTAQIVSALNWAGPLEVEVMRSDEDGRYYLLEINPRFPAWCFLCQAAGQNLPLALVMTALGGRVKPFTSYDVGLGFVRSARDLIFRPEEFEAVYSRGEMIKERRVYHA